MRVRFSPDIFRVERFGGVARYVTEVHRGLLALGVDSRILAGLHRNGHLAGVDGVVGMSIDAVRPAIVRQAISKGVDRSLERFWATGKDASTIYHKTYFDRHVPVGPRLVVTVYDMIHERFPGTTGARDHTVEAKRITCEAASVVLAISDTTRVDLLDRFSLDPDRVVTTHLGVRRVEPSAGAAWIDGSPYVLYVGGRRGYKNFAAFVPSLARAGAARDCRLVCFGGGPFDDAEHRLLDAHGLVDRTVQVTGDDRDLAAAYAGASALVYPSLYEGFGLPPLEAMVHGCPVAATSAGSVPEVVGDAAVTFDPTDPDAATDAIDRVLTDDDLRDRLVRAGHRRAAGFTWEATAAATLAAYQQVDRPAGRRMARW
jgi:glycosyltransferase involved in cell wall biosynthesis